MKSGNQLKFQFDWWKRRLYFKLIKEPFAQTNELNQIRKRRLSPHGFLVPLDCNDWLERAAFHLGFYYEAELTAVLTKLLRPGDCYVDIGANLGLLAFTASSIVEKLGIVVAVEPNPAMLKRLEEVIRLNNIKNLHVIAGAFGAEEGIARLNLTSHAGTANLRNPQAPGLDVQVFKGEERLNCVLKHSWSLFKIDVEGFECHVLEGLGSILSLPQLCFLIEITDDWLQKTGRSADAIFNLMNARGYSAYFVTVTFMGKLSLIEIDGHLEDHSQYNVIFLRQNEGWFERELS